MLPVNRLLEGLQNGSFLERMKPVYGDAADSAQKRAVQVVEKWKTVFPGEEGRPAALFSAPGRTELGGNHTDHEHGCVLAAAVNTDMLACAAVNQTNVISFQSEGWPMLQIDLSKQEPQEAEKESTAALIRGIAARITELGYPVSGFDAYAVSDVLPGSGLSSSAAFEVLTGAICNHLFCGDALTAVEIAQIGQYAENVYFGKPSGLMDQMACSVGGVVAIDFADPAKPVIEQVDADLTAYGYALCIVDSGADHAELTGEYAAIPAEMQAVAGLFGKGVLRDVDEAAFYRVIPSVRQKLGDRAVLRAMHFFDDNRRAQEEADALRAGEFDRFLQLVRESGQSSWMYLQNICPVGSSTHQEMGVALAVAAHALHGQGAYRVHGGGFAGTIQAFVPLSILDAFRQEVEAVLGEGRCHILSFRSKGGVTLLSE